ADRGDGACAVDAEDARELVVVTLGPFAGTRLRIPDADAGGVDGDRNVPCADLRHRKVAHFQDPWRTVAIDGGCAHAQRVCEIRSLSVLDGVHHVCVPGPRFKAERSGRDSPSIISKVAGRISADDPPKNAEQVES